MPHLCSPTLLFLRRITPSRRHMAASPRLAAGPCVMGLGALVRSPALVPCVPRWPCRLAAAAPRGQGRCRPPPWPACRRRWCGKGQLAGGRGRGGRRRGRGGWRRGEAGTEAGVAGAGTERGDSREKGADRWAPLPCAGETTVQNSRMVNYERFSYLDGQEYPVLEFNGQNQTQAIVGWSKMNSSLILYLCRTQDVP